MDMATGTPMGSGSTMEEFSDFLPHPDPNVDAVEVVDICMTSLQEMNSAIGLEVCFNFSSDQCRAALGGNLNRFIQYAENPIFGSMVACQDWTKASIGPIIPGSMTRGPMQTVLVDIHPSSSSTTSSTTISSREKKKKEKETKKKETTTTTTVPSPPARRFLWTLQQERRPPRQGCWLIQSVVYVKNAYALTL